MDPVAGGAVIWRLDPEMDRIIDELPEHPVPREFVTTYGYRPIIGRDCWILCVDNTRFMNHSGQPNVMDTEDGTIALFDLPPKTELLCDYRTYDKNPLAWLEQPADGRDGPGSAGPAGQAASAARAARPVDAGRAASDPS
jgi:hypothetical protein